MKKTLIALALVSLPVAAMADVTLYGQLKGGVDFKQTKVGGHKDGTTTNVGDYGSRIGFKGFEDLGNGLKAIWQVEQSVSLAGDTGKGWSNRETFVGLEGGFGKIRVGNLENFAKSDMETTDQWEYADNTPALGLAIFNQNNHRYGQSIRYDSPEFAGFYGSLQYTNSDDRTGQNYGINNGEKEKSVYGVGLGYNYGPYFAKYAFTLDKAGYNNEDGKRKDAQIHRVEGGYDANNLLVAVGYEYGKGVDSFQASALKSSLSEDEYNDLDLGTLNNKVKSHQVAVTGAYTMGNLTPKVSYAHGFKQKDAASGDKIDNSKYDQVIIGADYALSKRTTALVSAGWLRVGKGDDKLEQTAGSVGLRHKF